MIYDDWCYRQNCPHCIDWQFSIDGYEQPYDCTSCKLQGQSYNITEIAKDCPFNKGVPWLNDTNDGTDYDSLHHHFST